MDDTPSRVQGAYNIWVKPDTQRVVKLNISGSPTLVIVPQWYIKNGNPLIGTKYFNLVKAGTIYKFMEEDLNAEGHPAGWNSVGAEHCAQTGKLGIYELKEITLKELNDLFPSGGKKSKSKSRKNTTKNRRKNRRKSRKNRRKSKKHKKKV